MALLSFGINCLVCQIAHMHTMGITHLIILSLWIPKIFHIQNETPNWLRICLCLWHWFNYDRIINAKWKIKFDACMRQRENDDIRNEISLCKHIILTWCLMISQKFRTRIQPKHSWHWEEILTKKESLLYAKMKNESG